MISEFSISEVAISSGLADFSVADPFAVLLKNPEAQLQYLVELSPYDDDNLISVDFPAPIAATAIGELDFSVVGGLRHVYIADTLFITEPDDSPANTAYLPVTNNPFQFDTSILNGNDFRGGSPSFGAVRIQNGDGNFDDLGSYFWSGRAVKVYAGGTGFKRSEYAKIFEGVAEGIEFDEDEIIVNLADKSNTLETEFTPTLYDGTGGLEGGADLEGSPKPLCYGVVKNIPLVLVDSANLIYQAHDGSVEAIDAVYDRGVAITAEGDVADITAASVTAGHFKTQLSGGYIKLGSTPDGTITGDVQGDNTGGYINRVGAIAKRILKTRLGAKSFSDADIDLGAMNSIDTRIDDNVGLYINDSKSLKSVLDELFVPLHAYWTFSRLGQFTGGVIDSPSAPILTLTADDVDDDSFSVERVIPPAWRISLGYKKSWKVQSADDVASGATTVQKDFVKEQYRKVINEDRITRTKTANSREIEFNALLDLQADALSQMDRLIRIYREQRQVVRIKGLRLLFRVFVGDVVNLQLPRYGLSSGKNFLITRVNEDIETNSTELELWG